tara:strand:- start:61 stop:273 length:213 start_codon:yes stop_codon:yes gene_type:complete
MIGSIMDDDNTFTILAPDTIVSRMEEVRLICKDLKDDDLKQAILLRAAEILLESCVRQNVSPITNLTTVN